MNLRLLFAAWSILPPRSLIERKSWQAYADFLAGKVSRFRDGLEASIAPGALAPAGIGVSIGQYR